MTEKQKQKKSPSASVALEGCAIALKIKMNNKHRSRVINWIIDDVFDSREKKLIELQDAAWDALAESMLSNTEFNSLKTLPDSVVRTMIPRLTTIMVYHGGEESCATLLSQDSRDNELVRGYINEMRRIFNGDKYATKTELSGQSLALVYDRRWRAHEIDCSVSRSDGISMAVPFAVAQNRSVTISQLHGNKSARRKSLITFIEWRMAFAKLLVDRDKVVRSLVDCMRGMRHLSDISEFNPDWKKYEDKLTAEVRSDEKAQLPAIRAEDVVSLLECAKEGSCNG